MMEGCSSMPENDLPTGMAPERPGSVAIDPTVNDATRRQERYLSIQAARFIAAVAVVAYHVVHYIGARDPALLDLERVLAQGALIGVFLFFSISGFVLSHSLQRTTAILFVIHRFLRIYCAYWMAIAITVMASLFLLGSYPFGEWILPALLLIPLGEIRYPLGVEWSLVYEVSYYLLLGLIWWRRSNVQLLACFLLWIALLLVSSTLSLDRATSFLPKGGWILLSSFNFSFAFGVLAYFLHTRISGGALELLFPAAAAAFAVGVIIPKSEWRFLALGTGSALLVLSLGIKELRGTRKTPGALLSLLSRYGDYSYGLYLLHVPAITIFAAAVARSSETYNVWLRIVCASAVAVFAGLAFGACEVALYRRTKRKVDVGARRISFLN
jgi:exopolysaccharide production protein ExoZ